MIINYINATFAVLFTALPLKAEHTNTQRIEVSIDAGIPDKIDTTHKVRLSQQDNGRKITGIVIDDLGEALPGATIVVKESKRGTTTDLDGKFSLTLSPEEKTLVISFVGLETQEIAVQNNTDFHITMKPASEALDEVIVTGYQTISKERATGSYNMVRSDQIEKPATNIGQRLVGTSTGVQTTSDADGNISFEIRGQSSLVAAAQPLIVVDGFPIQGDLNSVNPNDIANITILKDAAAASIWGARSANGVIVITSKSGASKGKGVTVDFNSFITYSPKIDVYYLNPHASSAEVVEYEREGFATNFFGGPVKPYDDSNTNLLGGYSQAVIAMNEHRLGFLSTAEMEAILADLSTKDNREQIKKLLLQNPFTQQYNVSIASSTDRSSNILTLLYENRKLNYRGNDNNKYNVNFRNMTNLFKWLDFSFLGTFVMDDSRNNGEIYSGPPYDMLLNDDGSKTSIPYLYYMPNIKRHVPYTSFPYDDWSYNPLTELESKDFKTRTLNARAQIGLTFKMMQGLSFDSKIQYEIINSDTKNIYNEESFYVRYNVNWASSWNTATNEITPNLPKGGFLDQERTYTSAYNWRNQLNFNRDFFGRDEFSFIAGSEISDIVTQNVVNPRTYGYNDDQLTVGKFPNGVGGSGELRINNWLGQSQTFNYTNSYKYSTDRYFSLYGNASYTIDNKYTLSASARTDASNLITDDPKYRYSPFWSVGASWVMSKEKFMQKMYWLDRLVIRSTYGYNGNVDKSTSFKPLINVLGTQNSYIHDFTARIGSYGNPSLRWEKTGSFNFGVDFSVLKNKLYGKIDLYNKKGRDLIINMSIPAVNGTNTQKLNMAEMTNRGVELELGTTQKIRPNIVWRGNLSLSYNHNRIDELYKTTYDTYELYNGGTSAYVKGYDANTLWSYKYAGVVNKGTADAPNWQPMIQGKGDELYDFYSWPPGDARDYMLNMGSKVAPFTLGFTNSFKIYDFDLSFIITGKFGHVFNGFIFNYPSMSGGNGLPNKLYAETLNADPADRVPIPIGKEESRYYYSHRFYTYLDYRVQNASHIRFQELNLTYNINQKLIKKIGLSSAKLYAQANNLFIIANNEYNEDPEFPLGTLKPQPAYTLGINISF